MDKCKHSECKLSPGGLLKGGFGGRWVDRAVGLTVRCNLSIHLRGGIHSIVVRLWAYVVRVHSWSCCVEVCCVYLRRCQMLSWLRGIRPRAIRMICDDVGRSSCLCTRTCHQSSSARRPSTRPSAAWAPCCSSCTHSSTTTGPSIRWTAAPSHPKALVRAFYIIDDVLDMSPWQQPKLDWLGLISRAAMEWPIGFKFTSRFYS